MLCCKECCIVKPCYCRVMHDPLQMEEEAEEKQAEEEFTQNLKLAS